MSVDGTIFYPPDPLHVLVHCVGVILPQGGVLLQADLVEDLLDEALLLLGVRHAAALCCTCVTVSCVVCWRLFLSLSSILGPEHTRKIRKPVGNNSLPFLYLHTVVGQEEVDV